MRFVPGRVAGIGHDHEAIRPETGDDQIVDDPGPLIEQEGVFRLRHAERGGIERAGPGEQTGRLRPGNLEQPHMRDVEQPRMLARVLVFLHHAGRILDRHRPAREWPEACAARGVNIFKR